MAMATWTEERAGGGLTVGRAGETRAGRKFSIVASDEVEAERILRTEVDGSGVRRGSVYRTRNGRQYAAVGGGVGLARPLLAETVAIRERVPAPAGGQGLFEAEVSYKTVAFADPNEPPNEALPARYQWGAMFPTQLMDIDAKGEPILNTLGEPLDPPIEDEVAFTRLTVDWWVRSWDVAERLIPYQGAVNSDRWTIQDPAKRLVVEPGMARIKLTKGDPQEGLFPMSAEVEIKPLVNVPRRGLVSAFDVVRMNAGFRHKPYVNGELKPIAEIRIDGEKVSTPQALDDRGVRVDSEWGSRVHWLVIQTQPRAAFSKLGI